MRRLALIVLRLRWFGAVAGCGGADHDVRIPEFIPCDAIVFGDTTVEIRERQFISEGKPIVPHGVNSYPLLQHIGEDRWDAVRDILGQSIALGRPLVRTNAFMDGGDNPARIRDADGTIREEGLAALDALIAEASAFGVRLLLVLTNNWSDYGGAPAIVRAISPSDPLPKDAFWSDPRALEMQRDYIRAVVGRVNGVTGVRYGEERAIFAWELANEPRCEDPAYCTSTTLAEWARTMSAEVRAAGAAQPVTWGGSGYREEHGENLEAIARDGGVDVLTVHVYAKPEASQGPTDGFAASERVDTAVRDATSLLYDRIALANDYGMPLLVEEIGYNAPEDAPDRDAERSEVLQALLAVVHDAGIPALPWMIGESGRPDYDGYLIRPEDERTLEVIACTDQHK